MNILDPCTRDTLLGMKNFYYEKILFFTVMKFFLSYEKEVVASTKLKSCE